MSAIALVVVLAAAPSIARGQSQTSAPDVAGARAHFERGQRLFKVSRYREALEQFKEGYLIKPDPVFLYNIAQCHRLLGERTDAIMFYRRYLEAAPESRNRPEVERRIADLEEANRAAASLAPPPAPVAPPPVAPPPAPAAPEAAVTGQAPARDERPVYRRWWFWTGVGAAVAAGVVTAVLLSRSSPSGCGPNLDACHEL